MVGVGDGGKGSSRAVAKAMVTMQERVKVLTAERDGLASDLALLTSNHADLTEAHNELTARFDGEVDRVRSEASKEVKHAGMAAQTKTLSLHRELDFVKDLAQSAESGAACMGAHMASNHRAIGNIACACAAASMGLCLHLHLHLTRFASRLPCSRLIRV